MSLKSCWRFAVKYCSLWKVKASVLTSWFLNSTFCGSDIDIFWCLWQNIHLWSHTSRGMDQTEEMDVTSSFQVIAQTEVNIYTDGQCYSWQKIHCSGRKIVSQSACHNCAHRSTLHFEPVTLPDFIDRATQLQNRWQTTVLSLVAEMATQAVPWHKNALFVVNVWEQKWYILSE